MKWVKCATWLTLRSASIEPSTEEAKYIRPPYIMKRRVGECTARCIRPHSVPPWLMLKATTGITIITLCTIDSVVSQPGTGPPIRWWPPTWG